MWATICDPTIIFMVSNNKSKPFILIKSILKINFSKPYLSNIYLFLNVSNIKGLDLVLLIINIIVGSQIIAHT